MQPAWLMSKRSLVGDRMGPTLSTLFGTIQSKQALFAVEKVVQPVVVRRAEHR
jgi:hypothetical protein